MSKAKTAHRVQIIVPLKQYNAWAAESKRSGVPLSEMIRRAMESSLASAPARRPTR